jgi:hypothetical protein
MTFLLKPFKQELSALGFSKFVDQDENGDTWGIPGVQEYSLTHHNNEVILLVMFNRYEVSLSTRGSSPDLTERKKQNSLPQNMPHLVMHTRIGNAARITEMVENYKNLFLSV